MRVWRAVSCLSAALRLCTPVSVIWRQLWRSKHSCSRHHTYHPKWEWGCGEQWAAWVLHWGSALLCRWSAVGSYEEVSTAVLVITLTCGSREWGCGEQWAAWVLHWGSALLCRWSGRSYEEVSTAVLVITLTFRSWEWGCGEQWGAWVLHWGSALLCRWSACSYEEVSTAVLVITLTYPKLRVRVCRAVSCLSIDPTLLSSLLSLLYMYISISARLHILTLLHFRNMTFLPLFSRFVFITFRSWLLLLLSFHLSQSIS